MIVFYCYYHAERISFKNLCTKDKVSLMCQTFILFFSLTFNFNPFKQNELERLYDKKLCKIKKEESQTKR